MPRLRSRRSFLRELYSVLLAPSALLFMRGRSIDPEHGQSSVNDARDLGELLGSESAGVLGEACRHLTPCQGDAATLARRIGLDLEHLSGTAWQDTRSRMAHDFEDGRTVRVDGWVLSHTEARLYALAARLQSRVDGVSGWERGW